jgi:hypothetical protein
MIIGETIEYLVKQQRISEGEEGSYIFDRDIENSISN